MKHHGLLRVGGESMDFLSKFGSQWVVGRSHHHTERTTPVPLQFKFCQCFGICIGGSPKQFKQIAFQSHHDGLSFRVTHSAVEFKHFELAFATNHQPGIQKT